VRKCNTREGTVPDQEEEQSETKVGRQQFIALYGGEFMKNMGGRASKNGQGGGLSPNGLVEEKRKKLQGEKLKGGEKKIV